MRLALPRRRLALLAFLPGLARAEAAPWAGAWTLLRDDPQRRGAALPFLQLDIAATEEPTAPALRWTACEPLCEGAQGLAREVVADEAQLSCLIDLPPGPARLVLTRGEGPWVMGRFFPGGGGTSHAIAARRTDGASR